MDMAAMQKERKDKPISGYDAAYIFIEKHFPK